MKWYHWTEFTWLLSGSDISRGTGYPLQKLGIIYCYLCEKVFLPFYLLRDYISTKLFSSNCRPHCVLIFLPIWFLSRQLTLYFRSRRWLKTLHHIFLVTTVRSFYTSPCINCCHLLLQDDGTKFIKLLRALEAYAEGSSADPIIRRATYLWNKLKSWWRWCFHQWL